ncbi:MAG: cytidylate kinase family protein [Desulfobacteraceae bacterium]|jgi:cytidylate kinase
MAIITISRGCFSHGKEIAERVAERLNYECISREILIEASRFFHVSEKGLIKCMEKEPSILDRITHGREKYLTYIKAALLEHVKSGNVVYHGHAGHLLLKGIPCVLKIRIVAAMKERIRFLSDKEQITAKEAVKRILAEDRKRANWTKYIYKKDINDTTFYDLVIRIQSLTIDDACNIICNAASSPHLDTKRNHYHEKLSDLTISTHVRAALAEIYDVKVSCKNGIVHIKVPTQKIRKNDYITPYMQSEIKDQLHGDMVRKIAEIAKTVPAVKDVICDIEMPYYH